MKIVLVAAIGENMVIGREGQLPTMRLNTAVRDIFAFRYEDFSIENYDPHPHIKAAVAV